MTDQERQLLVGKLMIDLTDCILNMQRSSSDADKLTDTLRVLANCFDKEKPESRILKLLEDKTYMFRDPENRRSQLSCTMTDESGREHPLSDIPDGDRLFDLAMNIQQNRDRAEELLQDLKRENVDIRGICQVLSNQ